ncbi:hypothetical protein [Streptomyces sp. NPDC059994]
MDKPHRPINVPGTLGKLVDQMMRRNPADRPTIQEVCASLAQVAA